MQQNNTLKYKQLLNGKDARFSKDTIQAFLLDYSFNVNNSMYIYLGV